MKKHTHSAYSEVFTEEVNVDGKVQFQSTLRLYDRKAGHVLHESTYGPHESREATIAAAQKVKVTELEKYLLPPDESAPTEMKEEG